MAYTTINDPAKYFVTKLWTGNGSTQDITGLKFSPDLVWLKNRDSGSQEPCIYDTTRGVQQRLFTSGNATQSSSGSGGLTAFNSDGFSLGSAGNNNGSGVNYVSWNWLESSVGGFDIVSYTGNGSNRTISHSLGAVPKWMIVKNISTGSENFGVYVDTAVTDETDYAFLNKDNAFADSNSLWNDTKATSSVFSVGTSDITNQNGASYIAWLWCEKKGFSKFGFYKGTSNTNNFVYTGFRPNWIMFKRATDTQHWTIIDTTRSTFNDNNLDRLHANENIAETTGGEVDFLSNGFRHTSFSNWQNIGSDYVYFAFAESPFVNSNGVPTNAR